MPVGSASYPAQRPWYCDSIFLILQYHVC